MKKPTLGVEEALGTLFASVVPLAPVSVSLENAGGLVLAEDVVSDETHPTDDTSAMDGYALKAQDLISSSKERPVSLRVLADVAAGTAPDVLVLAGTACRISTGGLVPQGADTVIPRELVAQTRDDEVVFETPISAGANIRRAGEHVQPGDRVLQKGDILNASELGMAAFLGREQLLCFPRVKVAVLATGNELRDQSESLSRGQIRDSNSIALARYAEQTGCEVVLRQRVLDTAEDLDAALARASSAADVVITSGGISAGWHDLVRERIEAQGGKFLFHKLRMRPGKPIAFGRTQDALFLCLPGNPVSSLVTFEVFARPALCKLMGKEYQPRLVTATLKEPLSTVKGLTVFVRVALERVGEALQARPSGPQGSHLLTTMVKADGLVAVGEDSDELPVGTQVVVRLLD